MSARPRLPISVGRRIAFLVIAEALLMGVLIGHIDRSLSKLDGDLEYSRRFTLAGAKMLPGAMEKAAALEAIFDLHPTWNASLGVRSSLQVKLAELAKDIEQYRTTWMAADNPSEDARKFRDELARAGESLRLEDERRAVAIIDRSLDRLNDELTGLEQSETAIAIDNVRMLRKGLRELLQTNVQYVATDHAIHEARAQRIRATALGFGLAGFLLSLLLGLHVQKAVGPRLTAMARKVRAFQETGEFVRTPNAGSDEIAVLSNALDSGFAAIRERDDEREKFLSVVAHELKTPLTSIAGFIDAARASAVEGRLVERALDVIHRQTRRLNRLVQDLLLATNARRRQLTFQPKPLEGRALVKRALDEVVNGHPRFQLEEGTDVFLLADEELLSHALAQIFTYAAAVAERGCDIRLAMCREGASVILDVQIGELAISSEEIESAFLPFGSVQYEGDGLRYAVGLYLSREIANLHGGKLAALVGSNKEATLRLELPA
jgi:signal transduction histidine kinase